MHQSNEDAISSSKKPHPSPRGDNIKVKKHKFRTCSPSPGVIIIRKTAYKYQLSLSDNNYPLHVEANIIHVVITVQISWLDTDCYKDCIPGHGNKANSRRGADIA